MFRFLATWPISLDYIWLISYQSSLFLYINLVYWIFSLYQFKNFCYVKLNWHVTSNIQKTRENECSAINVKTVSINVLSWPNYCYVSVKLRCIEFLVLWSQLKSRVSCVPPVFYDPEDILTLTPESCDLIFHDEIVIISPLVMNH